MKIKKKVSPKPETAKGNTEAELEEALEKVNKEIEENGLQSNQSTNPPKEKKKMATKKSAKKTSAKKSNKNSPVEKTSSSAPSYLAKDLAAEFDIAPAELRKALRAIKAEKPGASWAWPKKTDKGLVEIRKALKEHFKSQAQKAKADSKSTPKKKTKKEAPEKKSTKKTSKKKSKKK